MNLGDNGVTYMSLPPNFQTKENNALGYAVDRQLNKLMEAAGIIAVWTNFKNVPDKYYDYMAASIRAPYYASQYDANTRLGILESAFQLYMFAGTCRGVEELVGRVFSGEAVFVPWYEYNGEPYHFRISVHSSPVRDTLDKFREILKRVKSKRSVLDVVEYIINFIICIPEQMDIIKTSLHTQVFFWGCDILNGTRLLDGSVLVDARRRYNLVLGIKNSIKFYIKENMDTDRLYINILSCFNAQEKNCVSGILYRFGGFGFWFPGSVPEKYKLPLKISIPVHFNIKQDIDAGCIVNGNIKVNTEEKTVALIDLKAAVNFLQNCHQEAGRTGTVIKNKHRTMVKTQMAAENVTITYRRNLCYLDGSERLDGLRLVNAFYGKEEI